MYTRTYAYTRFKKDSHDFNFLLKIFTIFNLIRDISHVQLNFQRRDITEI